MSTSINVAPENEPIFYLQSWTKVPAGFFVSRPKNQRLALVQNIVMAVDEFECLLKMYFRGARTYVDMGTCPHYILRQSLENVLFLNVKP